VNWPIKQLTIMTPYQLYGSYLYIFFLNTELYIHKYFYLNCEQNKFLFLLLFMLKSCIEMHISVIFSAIKSEPCSLESNVIQFKG